MRKTICAILMGSCALAYANAQTLFPVTSPDGSISLVLKLKEKGLYYTVSLDDLYNSYDDKTLSEEEMINEIKKESSL